MILQQTQTFTFSIRRIDAYEEMQYAATITQVASGAWKRLETPMFPNTEKGDRDALVCIREMVAETLMDRMWPLPEEIP